MKGEKGISIFVMRRQSIYKYYTYCFSDLYQVRISATKYTVFFPFEADFLTVECIMSGFSYITRKESLITVSFGMRFQELVHIRWNCQNPSISMEVHAYGYVTSSNYFQFTSSVLYISSIKIGIVRVTMSFLTGIRSYHTMIRNPNFLVCTSNDYTLLMNVHKGYMQAEYFRHIALYSMFCSKCMPLLMSSTVYSYVKLKLDTGHQFQL